MGNKRPQIPRKIVIQTEGKAKRTNKIAIAKLSWAQEVPSSNPGAPIL